MRADHQPVGPGPLVGCVGDRQARSPPTGRSRCAAARRTQAPVSSSTASAVSASEHHPAERREHRQHQVLDDPAVRREDGVADGVGGELVEAVARLLAEVGCALPGDVVEPHQAEQDRRAAAPTAWCAGDLLGGGGQQPADGATAPAVQSAWCSGTAEHLSSGRRGGVLHGEGVADDTEDLLDRQRGVGDPQVRVGDRDRMPPGAVGGDGGLGLEGVDRDVDARSRRSPPGPPAGSPGPPRRCPRWSSRSCRAATPTGSSSNIVAATRTRNPSDRASAMPSSARAQEPAPRWRSCSSGVAESRLTCSTTERSSDSRVSRRRPRPKIIALVRIVRSRPAPASTRAPSSGCMNGSPPVRNSSRPPWCGELVEDPRATSTSSRRASPSGEDSAQQ